MRTVLMPSRTRSLCFLGLVMCLQSPRSARAGDPTPDSAAFMALTNQTSEFLEVRLRTYALPDQVRQQESVENLLASRVGVADTRLVGMRVIVTVPSHLRFERMDVQVADGLFLVHETSKWRSVGRFMLSVARWLLIGRLVSSGDDLEVSATAWTLLLGNEQLVKDSIVLDTRDHASIEREDEMTTSHGDFVVCRMVMARNELSELVNMTIWATELDGGQPVRFVIPRLVLPEEES